MKNYIQNPNQKVVITFDNNTTLARIYENNKVIAKGIATCSPEDEFDIKAGSELAMTRALESMKPKQEWVVVNRKPRAGDYVRIKKVWFDFNRVGDILKVNEVFNNCNVLSVRACNHPRNEKGCKCFGEDYLWHYYSNTFEVVEPAPKKPEFRKINRAPKVGDYIRIVTPFYTFDAPGDVLKINHLRLNGIGVEILISDHPKLSKFLKDNHTNHYNNYWLYTHMIHDFEYVEKV